ncbi:MAG: class D sortase [Clostridia bacterium]
MKSKIINILKAILIILIVTLAVGTTVFLVRYEIQKKEIRDNIEYVYNIYNNDNSQEIFNDYITEKQEIGVSLDAQTQEIAEPINAIAVLEIPKIEFKDIVLEGTTQEILAEGIGLFEHSPILDGNVCLAGHNTSRFFKRLNELELGDTINYLSCLGKREYVVSDIQVISDTDWTMLEETSDNRITIITCVKNHPEVRLCVQAMEKI